MVHEAIQDVSSNIYSRYASCTRLLSQDPQTPIWRSGRHHFTPDDEGACEYTGTITALALQATSIGVVRIPAILATGPGALSGLIYTIYVLGGKVETWRSNFS